MKYYCGNQKPYIYVSCPSGSENRVNKMLENLGREGIAFWHKKQFDKKEIKHIEAAYAVMIFITNEFICDENLRKTVDAAVKFNKNILAVYLEDVEKDAWASMQLDSSYALYVKDYIDDESFTSRLKEAEIFREMTVTPPQKRFQRRRSITMVLTPVAAAAVLYFAIINPLMTSGKTEQETDILGIKGMSQEELDSVTEIKIFGDEILSDDIVEMWVEYENANQTLKIEIRDKYGNNTEDYNITRGSITDISDITLLRNLEKLQLSAENISDLTPVFELEKLKVLKIECNPVSSLEGIEKLQNLEELYITGTDISDLSPLQKLPKLRKLVADDTPIKVVPLLEKCTYYELDGTYADDIAIGAKEYVYLNIQNNKGSITDFSFLDEVISMDNFAIDYRYSSRIIPHITGKHIKRVCIPGSDMKELSSLLGVIEPEEIDLCWSDLEDISSAGQFTTVANLCVKGCKLLEDLRPVLEMPNLKILRVSSDQKTMVDEQLTGAKFKIIYEDN